MKKLTIILLLFALFSCQKEQDKETPKVYDLSGFAQKGPFLLGSEVAIIELNNNLTPTGKVFFSDIENDKGYFSFPKVEFESNFVQLKVVGEYYNEVIGSVNSLSEITLKSIVDISSNSTVNVNIITHLVQDRTLELVENGLTYLVAYNQAYNELLTIFHLDDIITKRPENLDLKTSDISGGILLVISAIIQSNIGSGYNFPEFLVLLTNDFKDNGLIDNEIVQNALGTSGLVLDMKKVKDNLTLRYKELGETIDPYSAQNILKDFNDLNSFPTIFDESFQNSYAGYINLINRGDTINIDKSKSYAVAIKGNANTDISNIQIRITSTSGNFSTSGVNWYLEENRKIYLMEYGVNDLIIPFEFSDSGEIQLELFIVTHTSSMVKYPKITIKWK